MVRFLIEALRKRAERSVGQQVLDMTLICAMEADPSR
jgi:hypothetical protein